MFKVVGSCALLLAVGSSSLPETEEKENGSAFVLLSGRSQTGKSELCNAASEDCNSEVGDGSGLSVSTKLAVGFSKALNAFLGDSPGFGDTDKRWKDGDILQDTSEAILAKTNATQIKIALMESLPGDLVQLLDNIPHLTAAFGADVLRSVVVVGTKQGIGAYGNRRIETVKELCAKWSLPFVIVDTMGPANELASELSQLRRALDGVKPLPLDNVRLVREQIEKRAVELRDEAGPICHNVTTPTEKLVPYEEEYTEDCIVRWERREVEACGGFWIFEDCETEVFQVPIKGKCTKYRTKYRTTTVDVTSTVCTERDSELFLLKATQEWFDQNRKNTAANSDTCVNHTQSESAFCTL